MSIKKTVIYCLTILTLACSQKSKDSADKDTFKEKESEIAEKELELNESDTSKLHQDKEKSDEEIISDIREKFGDINSNVNSYKKIKKDLMGESAEGGKLEGYYKNDELKKIIATYFGEMGKSIEEYYFWNNNLFFIFVQDYHYNMPSYLDDSKVDKIDENRYYFHNDKLIKWLDPDKKEISNSKFKQKETEILKEAEKLNEKLK